MAEGTDSTRKTLVSLESQIQLCIICQNDNKEKLMNVNHDGLQSVDNIRQLRTKLPTITFEMPIGGDGCMHKKGGEKKKQEFGITMEGSIPWTLSKKTHTTNNIYCEVRVTTIVDI